MTSVPPSSRAGDRTRRIAAAVQEGKLQEALALASVPGRRDPDLLNARGVCLMRLGRVADAITLYRSLVLLPGTSTPRADIAPHIRINFAAALLLGGHPGGCLEILHEFRKHPPAQAARLFAAVRQWESTLGWLEWLDWKVNRVEPRPRPIPIAFQAGLFDAESA